MSTIVVTAGFLAFLMLIMAIGVMVTGRPLSGSCGGVTGSCSCSPVKRAKCAHKGIEAAQHSLATEEAAGTQDSRHHHLPVMQPKDQAGPAPRFN